MTATNPNTGLTVEAWAEITIKEWIKKSIVLGIDNGSGLAATRFIHYIVSNANGDPVKIQFMFDYFLNFVDWGVGKGVSVEHRDMLIAAGATKRRPKQWFTDVFYKEIVVLKNLLQEKYALKAAFVLINKETLNP